MIIYFSGCGNSRRVAQALAAKLGDELTEVARRTFSEAHLSVVGDERVVWVFPVYSWGVPPVMVDFIKRLQLEGGDKAVHHLVITCGDDAGLTDRQWRHLMERRGWPAASAHSVIMPNTYVLMKGFDVDSDSLVKKKLEASDTRIDEIARTIASGDTSTDIIRGSFPWIKSKIIYPWFVRNAMNPKPFHALDSCTSCGLCARSCPMENIKMSDGRPLWGDNCAMCLRCYHRCPVHAVAYGKATRGKGQYRGETEKLRN